MLSEIIYHNIIFNLNFRCVAGGFPTPTYEWFKEEYNNQDQLLALKIDPLSNSRFTLSGGTLIIYNPKRVKIKTNGLILYKVIDINSNIYIYCIYRMKTEVDTIAKHQICLVL